MQCDWVKHSENAQTILVGRCTEDWPLGRLRLWDRNVRKGLRIVANDEKMAETVSVAL
jgi:hypothetical protein